MQMAWEPYQLMRIEQVQKAPSNGLEASRIPLSGSRLRELKAQEKSYQGCK